MAAKKEQKKSIEKVLEGSHAVAEAVKIVGPKVIAAYPITPQTHIVEKLAEMVANSELKAEYLNVESEHSAMAACIGAQATGVRSYTATSSQGLALMWELLYVASGMRLPIVMTVANRALSAPLNIWNDWSDSIGARDSGWIQIYCKNAQEAYDTTIQAWKIGEDKKVQLPVMVCIDGFYLTHTFENVSLFSSLNEYIGDYRPAVSLDPKKPLSLGEYATPEYYQEFKEQQQAAMDNAIDIISNVNDDFHRRFGRKYGNGLIETKNMEEAKHVVITAGTFAETLSYVINKEKVRDIGLVRIRTLRPFPGTALQKALSETMSVAVVEKDISLGLGGAIASEIRGIVDKPVASIVGGLGGRDITVADIGKVFDIVRSKREGLHWLGSRL